MKKTASFWISRYQLIFVFLLFCFQPVAVSIRTVNVQLTELKLVRLEVAIPLLLTINQQSNNNAFALGPQMTMAIDILHRRIFRCCYAVFIGLYATLAWQWYYGGNLLLLTINVVMVYSFGLSLIIYFRHGALVARRQKAKETGQKSDVGDKPLLLVLIAGSGGHTTELMNMMYDTPLKGPQTHRVWVVTAGDQRSEREIAKFEKWLQSQDPGSGTHEVRNIPRARRVHQQWLTVPFSVLSCLRSVYTILTATYSHPTGGSRYPNAIITTGPGTGFIVSLGGWLLKILGLIPVARCQVVYIESIARVQTLSLTGKLFYYTNIADRFVVQHEKLGKKYHLEMKPYLAARSQPQSSDG